MDVSTWLTKTRASDIMVRKVVTLKPSDTLAHAAAVFLKEQISGAPVVDDTGTCVGVMSASGVLAAEEKAAVEQRKIAESSFWTSNLALPTSVYAAKLQEVREQIVPISQQPVGRFMTSDLVSVGADAPLRTVVEYMVNAHVHRVVVLDAARRLLGLVSTTDVLAALLRPIYKRVHALIAGELEKELDVVKGILVGLDGSPFSQSAVELGIRWAKQHDVLLVGLGIIDEPTICGPEPVPIAGGRFKGQRGERLLADARHKVDRFLERFSLQCTQAGVAFKVLEDVGLPADQIILEAHRYDLILLGRKTYFHFETEEGPDETVHRVVKDSPRPVVTVPSSSLRGGKCIVVAYDGSLQAARALQAFQATQLHESYTVYVVSIASEQLKAARLVDRAADFLRLHDIAAEPHPVATRAAPGEVLLEQVRKLDPVLVVMGAYGQPTWREFLFGSATRTMLKLSPVPLFLYH